MLGRQPNAESRKPSTGGAANPPFDLFISSFSILGGQITYADRSAGTESEIKNFNAKIAGFALALVKPIDLSASADITYQGKLIPLSIAGQVGVSMADESITIPSLSLSIAGESLSLTGGVSDWKTSPSVSFSANTNKFNLDPLLAIFAAPAGLEKPKPKPGELTKMVNRALAAVPSNVSLDGKVNLENISFQKFKADKIVAGLNLKNKIAAITLNEIDIYGGRLTSQASVDLNVPGLSYSVNGQTLKSNTLQDNIKFGGLTSAFTLKDQVAMVNSLKIDKPFEAAIGKLKVKFEAKKVEIEQRLKEEAKTRLKDFIKF